MIHVLVMGLPLVAGLALGVLAARRRWAPPLWAAVAVGAVLRAAMMLIAAQDTWQPYDLAVDFPATADAVLDGRDPLFELREGGWHFLPLLAYLLAGVRALGDLLGLPWGFTGRVVPVLADLALIPLVAKLSTDPDSRVRALRGLQYACAPVVLMVSAVHGQFGPITLVLGAAALLAARNGGVHLAGVLIGLSVTSANWSVLLLPGVLLAVPGLRRRLTVLGWTAVVPVAFLVSSVPVFGTPIDRLPATLSASLSARPVVGDWGWTAIVTGGEQVVSAGYGTVGTPVLALALLAAAWWWRKADPVALTLALLLVFLIVTYRFGAQYLMWPMPYLIMRWGRGTWPVIVVTGLWAAFAYLFMTRLTPAPWQDAHIWWALSSLVVIAFLIRALPARPRPASPDPS
ncbi:hypothetical protein [Spirillospora sp. NPDC048824]|uniref:hypothetical protein n=1 Tax=Spirillospora sp. NPDC048824 TaxID=3364526 RepID=UPI003719A110